MFESFSLIESKTSVDGMGRNERRRKKGCWGKVRIDIFGKVSARP